MPRRVVVVEHSRARIVEGTVTVVDIVGDRLLLKT